VRRRLLLGAGLLAGLAALGAGLPVLARRLEMFRVRRVEVVGLRYLEADRIVGALGMGPDASIFDPLGPLGPRVVAVPGVARATVHRRIPGTLIVRVEERAPVALAEVDDRLVLVDRGGRTLPFDPVRGSPDLPVATRDTAVLGVIHRVREGEPGLFQAVVAARREDGDVLLETATRRLLFRPGASPREIQGLVLVMNEVERRRMPVTEFDARFEGRVIVRGASRR
jgi:cell division protein FtsQ